MPEFPLFQRGQQNLLPALPGPVLDRETRPRVDVRGTISGIEQVKQAAGAAADASMAPLVPQDIFSGEARGNEALARGVQNFADSMGAFWAKRQELIDQRNIGNARNVMTSAWAQHVAERDKARPETWGQDLQQRMAALKKQLDGDKTLTNAARYAINQEFENFATSREADVLITSHQALFGQAKDLHEADIVKAKEAGDLPRVVQLRAVGVQNGFESQGQAQLSAIDDRKDINGTQRDNLMASHPREFRAYLQMPKEQRPEFMQDMSEAEELRAERETEASIERGKASVLAMYHERLASGEMRDPNDIWRNRAKDDPRGFLSDEDVVQVFYMMTDPEVNDVAAFESRHREIALYSAQDDPSGLKRAGMESRFLKEFKGPMLQELQQQLKEQTERTQAAGMDDFDAEYTRGLEELDQMFRDEEFGHFKFPAKNISYDDKLRSWVRVRDSWESPGPPVPIKISASDARKLTDGDVKDDVLVEDIDARNEAARKMAMRRWSLKKRWKEGKYNTATEMMDDFKGSIEQPTKEAARLKLPTWDAVPGAAVIFAPSQQSLPPAEQRKSIFNKYAPAAPAR